MSGDVTGADDPDSADPDRNNHGDAAVGAQTDGSELDLVNRPDVRTVRAWTAAALPHIGDELLDDLLLVVTELVANAYDHTAAAVTLRLLARSGHVRIEVSDTSPEPPVPGCSRIASTRGRGLVLIAALSTSWGHITDVAGKTVWAEFASDAGGGPHPSM